MDIYSLNEIYFKVGESKGTRLLRFSSLSGQDVRATRRNCAVEGSLGIDGEPFEFEWSIFPGFTTLQILQKIQDKLDARQTSPEEFEDRIVFMSMFNAVDWTKEENSKDCFSNSEKVKN